MKVKRCFLRDLVDRHDGDGPRLTLDPQPSGGQFRLPLTTNRPLYHDHLHVPSGPDQLENKVVGAAS